MADKPRFGDRRKRHCSLKYRHASFAAPPFAGTSFRHSRQEPAASPGPTPGHRRSLRPGCPVRAGDRLGSVRTPAARARRAALRLRDLQPGAWRAPGNGPHPALVESGAPLPRARGHDHHPRVAGSKGGAPGQAGLGPPASPRARRASRLDLLGSVRAGRDGSPRREARHHTLALYRHPPPTPSIDPGSPGCASRGRWTRVHVRGERGGNRPLPASRSPRSRRRGRESRGAKTRGAAASGRRAGPVHRPASFPRLGQDPRSNPRVGARPYRRADRSRRSGLGGCDLATHVPSAIQGRDGNVPARVAHAAAGLDGPAPSRDSGGQRGRGRCAGRVWHVPNATTALSPDPEDVPGGLPQAVLQAACQGTRLALNGRIRARPGGCAQ